MAHHDIELVAVNDQKTPAVGGFMDFPLADLDAAEMRSQIVAQKLVMVSGDILDLGTLAHLAQQLLDHIVVFLGPVPALAQPPAVDDVADQIIAVRIDALEK